MTDSIPDGFIPIEHSASFGRHTGPFYDGQDEAGFVRAFRPDARHGNSLGMVHGGMLMTFADIVLARAVREVAAGRPFVTLRMTSDFVTPARTGDWVEGRAKVTRQARGVVFVRGRLTVGNRLVLKADGLFRVLTPRERRAGGEPAPADGT
ncbi:MAG: PaaI family thioesterase [Alphaproteobacteria bacterium]|jgi:uncharacterized protein (TIGR00369 family)|nr:PaaI family thioesterase [Alphaproteobacteria bacterium]